LGFEGGVAACGSRAWPSCALPEETDELGSVPTSREQSSLAPKLLVITVVKIRQEIRDHVGIQQVPEKPPDLPEPVTTID